MDESYETENYYYRCGSTAGRSRRLRRVRGERQDNPERHIPERLPNGTDASATAASELGVNDLIVRDVVLPDESAAGR